MAIDRSGAWWKGTEADDLDAYLVDFKAGGYAVERVVHARCASCAGRVFRVEVDDEQGCARRLCRECANAFLMLDSADTVDDAELEGAACPCGGELFEVAVGFALYKDSQDVRWVSVALRCVKDGVLGVYADWKVDHSPSRELLEQA